MIYLSCIFAVSRVFVFLLRSSKIVPKIRWMINSLKDALLSAA